MMDPDVRAIYMYLLKELVTIPSRPSWPVRVRSLVQYCAGFDFKTEYPFYLINKYAAGMDYKVKGIYMWMCRRMPKDKPQVSDNHLGEWFTSSCISLGIKDSKGQPIEPWQWPVTNEYKS